MPTTQPRPENSHPTAARRRPKRDEVRACVLDAALTEFRTRGFDGASLDEIARLAGLSKGAVYSNFASKEDLFLDLMEHQVRLRIDAARRVAEPDSSPAASSMALGQYLTNVSTDDPGWHILFLEYVVKASRNTERLAALTNRRRALRAVATDAIDTTSAGHPEWDRDEAAVVLLALSNGLAIERLIDADAVPADLFGRLINRLLTPVAASAAARLSRRQA